MHCEQAGIVRRCLVDEKRYPSSSPIARPRGPWTEFPGGSAHDNVDQLSARIVMQGRQPFVTMIQSRWDDPFSRQVLMPVNAAASIHVGRSYDLRGRRLRRPRWPATAKARVGGTRRAQSAGHSALTHANQSAADQQPKVSAALQHSTLGSNKVCSRGTNHGNQGLFCTPRGDAATGQLDPVKLIPLQEGSDEGSTCTARPGGPECRMGPAGKSACPIGLHRQQSLA